MLQATNKYGRKLIQSVAEMNYKSPRRYLWNDSLSSGQGTYHFTRLMKESNEQDRCQDTIKIFKEMQDRKFPPTTRTYENLIQAHTKLHNFNECVKYISELKKKVPLDLRYYTTLITSCAALGDTEASEKYFKELEASGVELGVFVFNRLMLQSREFGNADACERYYNEMVRRNLKPDGVIFGHIINAFFAAKNVQKMEEYYGLMKQSMKPTIEVITLMMYVYEHIHDLEKCEEYFKEADRLGVEHNAKSFDAIIVAFYSKDTVKAEAYLYEMLRRNIEFPDNLPFQHVIGAFVHQGDMERAENCYNKFREVRAKSGAGLEVMMAGYAYKGNVEKCEELFELGKKIGRMNRAGTFNALLDVYAQHKRTEKMMEILGYMRQAKITATTGTFNAFIRLNVERKNVEQAENITEEMRALGLSWNRRTYSLMLELYESVGCTEKFEELRTKMKENNSGMQRIAKGEFVRYE